VDWACLFDVDRQRNAQRAKKLDGRLVHPLIALPAAIIGPTDVSALRSLATRDLERGQGVGLPSGEAVAKLMGEKLLTRDEIGTSKAAWSRETPLWYYVLREADVRSGGNRLGPVGGRIVGEVLIGLLDPSSVRHAPAEWSPIRPLIDLLREVRLPGA
jgi:hypothetical protein